jgi:hypothetical protein
MKSKYILTGLAAIIMASGVSCRKIDKDDLILSANLNIYKTIVNCIYTDATTGQPPVLTAASGLKVEVTNPLTGLVVEISSGKCQSLFEPNYPIASFALNPYSAVPSVEKPVVLLVKTTHPAYRDQYTTLTLMQERVVNEEIRLISRNNPPEGMDVSKFSDVVSSSATGATADSVDITSANGLFKLHIPAGTILKDKSGTPLTGRLSVEMISVDVSTDEGRRNMPGINQPLITADGKESAMFNPLTYSNMVISDEKGRIAAEIVGEPLTYFVSLTGSQPLPGSTFKTTTLLPGYLFNPNTGAWESLSSNPLQFFPGGPPSGFVATAVPVPLALANSHDNDPPIRIDLILTLPNDKPALPAGFTVKVWGTRYGGGETQQLLSTGITVNDPQQNFTFGSFSPMYANFTVKLMNETLMAAPFEQSKSSQLLSITPAFPMSPPSSAFLDPATGSATTRLYLQFACDPTDGNSVFMDSQNLPASFYLIFSGTGFTGETMIEITGGSFEVPFNPMLETAGVWQAKVVMGEMEYPEGTGRVTVTPADFFTADGKMYFRYTPATAGGCDEFKAAMRLN